MLRWQSSVHCANVLRLDLECNLKEPWIVGELVSRRFKSCPQRHDMMEVEFWTNKIIEVHSTEDRAL